MRTRLATTLGAALLALTLTSCSEDPEPIIEPGPTTSAPTSSDPPASPTTSPTPDGPESAKAFIRRWQDEAFAMQLSGDTSAYRAMSVDCESCNSLANSVDDIYEGGGSVRLRGDHTLSKLKQVGEVQLTLIFEYALDSPQSQVLDATGDVDERFMGGSNRYQVNLTRKLNQWRVSSASRISA